jgi:hypothetical protein
LSMVAGARPPMEYPRPQPRARRSMRW